SARSIQNSLVFSGNITLGNPTNNGTLTFTSTDGTNTLSTAATISLLGTATLTTLSPVSIVDNITQQFPSSGITKGGASTLTISGTNNYTGATTVSAGTLLVNNATGSGTGSGA